jgi:AbiU2
MNGKSGSAGQARRWRMGVGYWRNWIRSMSNHRKKEDWAAQLTVADRILSAERKINALIDRACVALKTHSSNNHTTFPTKTARPSAAATMFNHLQVALMKFEALELRSLWDRNSEERNSIPTVMYLVNNKDVKAELKRRAENQYPEKNPEGTLAAYYKTRRAEEIQKFDERFQRVLNLCTELYANPNFDRLRDFRDFEIAHSITKANSLLDPTKIYLAGPFWERTIETIDCLNGIVRLSSFDFEGSKKFAERLARAWWENLELRETTAVEAPTPCPSPRSGLG